MNQKIEDIKKKLKNELSLDWALEYEDVDWLIRVAEAAEKFIYHDGPPIPSMPMEAGCAFIDLKNALKGWNDAD